MKPVRQPKQYIAWENIDLEWGWSLSEINRVIEMWNQGMTVEEITEKIKRPFIETWLLVANLIWSNIIKPKAKIFCLPYSQRPRNRINLFHEGGL